MASNVKVQPFLLNTFLTLEVLQVRKPEYRVVLKLPQIERTISLSPTFYTQDEAEKLYQEIRRDWMKKGI